MKTRIIYGFSLAEALITLLIISIITLASIPVITKKQRDKTNVRHGSFACYWKNGNLIGRYSHNGNITNASTKYVNGQAGCVFDPPPGAKNFVITLVGGGGGGAAGDAENKYKYYTNGDSGTFVAPVTTSYEFLVAGAGGGGGRCWGGCGNAGDWPCGTSGTPGAVLVSKPMVIEETTNISVTSGAGGAKGHENSSGNMGGDSRVSFSGSAYELFAQGGGGGASPNYKGKNECWFYENTYSSSNGIYNRRQVSHKCSSKSTARNTIKNSGMPGGYRYRGFSVATAKRETARPNWWEFEKNGAYLLDADWNPIKFPARRPPSRIKSAYASNNSYNANRPYRNSAMTRDLMDKFEISSIENQTRPFAAGSSGDVSDGWGASDTTDGGPGVVSILWNQSYTGKGGSAGKTLQLSFAELPQHMITFPGRGGKGGYQVSERRGGGLFYRMVSKAPTGGEDSYVENYPHALGGTAAPPIDKNDPFTYYKLGGDSLTQGQDGALAGIAPKKEVTAGGAGGASPISSNGYINNNSINGLTRAIFKNPSAEIGSFNHIVGAGAGGGGGTVRPNFGYVPNISGNVNRINSFINNYIGKGADGSSGIVFIQW